MVGFTRVGIYPGSSNDLVSFACVRRFDAWNLPSLRPFFCRICRYREFVLAIETRISPRNPVLYHSDQSLSVPL